MENIIIVKSAGYLKIYLKDTMKAFDDFKRKQERLGCDAFDM